MLGGVPKALPAGGSAMLAVNLALVFIVNGITNGEEPGGHGFALTRPQGKYNTLVSSLILGVIWSCSTCRCRHSPRGVDQAQQSR